MANDEIRLCERCWRPIPPTSVCVVGRHADPAYPLLRPPHSYRHVYADPACTGSQVPGPGPAIGTTR